MIDSQTWRKSSYSAAEKECVEVGIGPGDVGIRDTKNCDHGQLTVTRTTWRSFIQHVAR